MDEELEVQPELEVEGEIESTEVDVPEIEGEEPEAQGGGRVQRLARERAEYREQLQAERAKREEYERLLHEQMLRGQQTVQPQEDLDPMQSWTKNVERTLQQNLFSQQDALDQTRYELKASQNTIYKKYQGKVEEELTKLRRNGSNAPRETILAYLVGQEALSGQLKAPKPKAATTTTPAMKSTVKPSKSEPTLKERLANIRL